MTNIALVVLDTLRKDAFDRHFEWLPGRRFERAYTTANWTVPAHASLFTGRYGSEVGVHAKHLYCDCPEPTLAERLSEAGYTTRAFSANTNITSHFEFDRGFTDFRTPELFEGQDDEDVFNWREFTKTTDATGTRRYLSGVHDCITDDVKTLRSLLAGVRLKLSDGVGVEYGGTREALAELRDVEFGDREFLFVNLMEAHEPYRAPEEYMTVEEPPLTNSIGDISLDEVDAERTRRAYDDCTRYLSDVYRELFDRLTAAFDYVITVSDHGEMLGEHGAWAHEHGVRPELTHVPLVISGDSLAGQDTGPTSLLDIHRTVLERAGVGGDSRGRDLLGDTNDGGARYLTEYHGLTSWSKRKLEANGYGDRVEEYDAALFGYAAPTTYYGYETTAGFEETGTADTDDPREALDRLVAARDVRRVERENEVPEEIKDHLEHLGYA
jgi:arylsulfatase